MAVDSGYHTHHVYHYCRLRPHSTMATKGLSTPQKPIINKPVLVDVNYQGEVIKEGVLLWTVGTDTAKAQIYNRLSMRKPGPGYYHFPVGLPDDYFLQLTAEKRVTQYRNGFPFNLWVKLRDRNEVLDCEVLALVAAHREGISFVNWEKVRVAQLGGAAPGNGNGRRRAKGPRRQTTQKKSKW